MYAFLTSTTLLRKVSVCEGKIFIWLKLLWSGLFWMALDMDMDCILSETCNPVLLQEKSSLIYSECWETQHLHETFSPSLHIRPCFVCSEIQPFLVSLSTGLYSGWRNTAFSCNFKQLRSVFRLNWKWREKRVCSLGRSWGKMAHLIFDGFRCIYYNLYLYNVQNPFTSSNYWCEIHLQ